MTGYIAFYRGKSWVSKCIKWFTRSEYSHVAYIANDGSVLEAWMPKVRMCSSFHEGHMPGTEIDLYQYAMSSEREEAFVAFIEAQVGKRYDTRGVLGFISRRPGAQRDNRYFCSELIVEASRIAEVPLIRRVPAYSVSPGQLSGSPCLDLVGTITTSVIDYWTFPGRMDIRAHLAEHRSQSPVDASEHPDAPRHGPEVSDSMQSNAKAFLSTSEIPGRVTSFIGAPTFGKLPEIDPTNPSQERYA